MLETLIGVILALVATIMFNLAPIFQKGLVDDIPEIEIKNLGSSIKAMFQSPRWLLGTLMGVFGGIPYFFALQLAGIIVVQPLLNFGFIAMVIAANRMLGESLDLKSKIAILLMMIMPVFIAFADVSEAVTLTDPADFLLLNLIYTITILITGLFGKKVPVLWAFTTGLCFSLGALNLQAVTLNIDFGQIDTLISQIFGVLHWAILSGLFNIVGTFLAQIGLQRNEASKFNPINQTLNNTGALLGGVVIFLQVPGSIPLYTIGFLMGAIGVAILGRYEITDELIEERLESPLDTSEAVLQADGLGNGSDEDKNEN